MIRNDLIQLLQRNGLKPSLARLNILNACEQSDLPLDVQQVASKIAEHAHLATIYRTLEKFVSVGLLARIDFQEGKFRYEYMHTHHHHAVCESCGKIEDVTVEADIQGISSHIRADSGFEVKKHVIELFGLCNKCQKGHHYVN